VGSSQSNMKLYKIKKLNFGFIILCSDRAVKLLQSTAYSIKNRYVGIPYICATDNGAKKCDIKEMQEICPTFKGKNTFSSLINVGFKNAVPDWNFVVFAGSTVRSKLDDKFSIFIDSNKDILFPIAEQKYDFINGTLNGILIHKETFKEVGNIEEDGNLDFVKTIWCCKAIEKGCRFKAVSNTKIC